MSLRLSRGVFGVASVAALLGGLLVAAVSGSAPADAQNQRCLGRQVTIVAAPGVQTVGTNGDDVILGTNGDDVIRSRGGDDRICARGGDDIIRAGRGADRIRAGSGADTVTAGPGRDIIKGNGGADDLRGNNGDDTISGGKGRDSCRGGSGNDTLTSCNESPAQPTATPAPTPTATPDPRAGCHPSYPTVCIPPPPPDLDCGDIPHRRFRVRGSDPHRFDLDGDGIGCES